jgi:hypothetical protein
MQVHGLSIKYSAGHQAQAQPKPLLAQTSNNILLLRESSHYLWSDHIHKLQFSTGKIAQIFIFSFKFSIFFEIRNTVSGDPSRLRCIESVVSPLTTSGFELETAIFDFLFGKSRDSHDFHFHFHFHFQLENHDFRTSTTAWRTPRPCCLAD